MDENFSNESLKAHIMYKLARHRRWGAKHTELINVRSALPREHQHLAEELARELADEGFLTWLKKTGQIHVSLNPHRRAEIIKMVENYYGKQIW
ncbi:MAG: hypothetical protein V1728_01160 [Candidatus Micrarchaeota archaeon]